MLSAILNDQTKYDDVISVAHPEMCYSDANRRVFDAIAELREAGKPLDVVTVAHTLNAAGRLAQIGGTQYLAQLIDAVPHVANVVEYATIVREQWRLRQAMARAQVVIATIRAGKIASDDVQAVLEEAETAFGLIAHQQQSKFLVPIKESLDEACQALRLMIERGETITGTPILFKPLDEAMSGLHEGDLYIVAGRPGMGKTAFAMGIGENVAKQDEGVAVFSLEMPDSQLVTRMLASHTRIDVTTFRKPRELADKWAEIVVALGEMEKLPIWIDDTGGISISEIRARVRKLKSDIAHNRVGDVK
jgi:replicative DNA helicase